MEEIFKRIIEIENRAKEVYQNAVLEKKQMQEAIMAEIKKRESEIKQMAEEKIQELVLQSQKDNEEKLQQLNQLLEEKLSMLEAAKKRNAGQWENAILKNITGE